MLEFAPVLVKMLAAEVVLVELVAVMLVEQAIEAMNDPALRKVYLALGMSELLEQPDLALGMLELAAVPAKVLPIKVMLVVLGMMLAIMAVGVIAPAFTAIVFAILVMGCRLALVAVVPPGGRIYCGKPD
jgi:hypothetical protein